MAERVAFRCTAPGKPEVVIVAPSYHVMARRLAKHWGMGIHDDMPEGFRVVSVPPPPNEHSILYAAPMVLALLAGRKTQTRRLSERWDRVRPGDRLWVRETWRTYAREADGVCGVLFAADGTFQPIENTRAAADAWVKAHNNGSHGDRWRPSIHMPRWASRILLETTAPVRQEHLHDISEADAQAEGIERMNSGRGFYNPVTGHGAVRIGDWFPTARAAFEHLWKSIHGAESWTANPLLRVVSFQRVEAPGMAPAGERRRA